MPVIVSFRFLTDNGGIMRAQLELLRDHRSYFAPALAARDSAFRQNRSPPDETFKLKLLGGAPGLPPGLPRSPL